MKHFFSKLPEFLGMFLLRSLLLLGALTCFGAGVFLSWEHTAALALSHGLTGELATAYTILIEVLLSMCEVALIFLILLGKKTNWSIKVGLLFGLSINLTANVLSLKAYGVLGIAIGISIPIGSAISAWVFASALVKEVEKTGAGNNFIESLTNLFKKQPKPAVENIEENHIADTSKKAEEPTTTPEPESPTIETTPPDEPAPTTPEPLQPIPLQEPEQKAKPSTSRKAKSSKGKGNKTPASKVDYDAIMEVAKQLQTERPKVGRDFLAKAAGTTPHHARIALLKLEQEDKVS